jgi:MFS family permease
MTQMSQQTAAPTALTNSAWSPLRVKVFRDVWIATIVSNIGTWAQEFGGPWLMRLLTPDKLWVGLVSFASNLPLCFLSAPAGVLADMLDRRRFLIFTQIWMLIASGALGVLTLMGVLRPEMQGMSIGILLGFTALLAIGNALSGPPFQAIVPELVPPGDMPLAVSLNSVALNVARAVGPAVGMLIAALAAGRGVDGEIRGLGAAFIFNAISFIGVAWVIFRWNRPKTSHAVQAEEFWPALRTGFVYTRHSRAMQFILLRVFIFIICAVVMWSQLATIAKDQMGLGSLGYAMLMVSLGTGAVIGVIFMPQLQKALDIDRMVLTCTAGFALGMMLLSQIHGVPGEALLTALAACPVMMFIGFNWVVIPTNFNIATQRSGPNWVKGRALSMYLTVLFGTWAIGSVFWGWIAHATQSTSIPLLWASVGLLVSLLLARQLPLTLARGMDFAPAQRPAISPVNLAELQQGPVRVVIEYHVGSENHDTFHRLMRDLRRRRLQNGAAHWQLDNGDAVEGKQIFREAMIFRSWSDRMRNHLRTTKADLALENQIHALHGNTQPPVVAHLPHRMEQAQSWQTRFTDWTEQLIDRSRRETFVWQRRFTRSRL